MEKNLNKILMKMKMILEENRHAQNQINMQRVCSK